MTYKAHRVVVRQEAVKECQVGIFFSGDKQEFGKVGVHRHFHVALKEYTFTCTEVCIYTYVHMHTQWENVLNDCNDAETFHQANVCEHMCICVQCMCAYMYVCTNNPVKCQKTKFLLAQYTFII